MEPVLLVMAAIPSATWMPYSRAASILGGISLVILLAHWFVALKNPNANKERNREKAEKLVAASGMQAVSKPREDQAEGDPPAVAPDVKLWLVGATLGFLLILALVLLKTVNGWKSNDGLKPEVVGLGDTVHLVFDTRIDCVQSLWSGGARAGTTVDGRWVPLPTVTQTSDWEVQMSVKSGERHTSPVLWADVMVPSDPALAGQTLALTVSMPVRFPTMGGGNAFDDQVAQATLNRDLYVSAAGARQVYWLTFWTMVVGALLMAVAGVVLSTSANSLKAAAPDTRVTPIRETDEESAD